MKHLNNFENFNEDVRVKKIIEYIDLSVNESLDIKSIWSNTLNKIKGLSQESKRKVVKYAVLSLLSFNTITNVVQIINSSSTPDDIKQIATEVVEEKEEKYKAGYDFTLSQEGWDHIKDHEKLKLKAYKIGDGMVTIGYGHAERVGKSKYNVGDVISEEEANKLLKEDLKEAADGVRRMFRDWESEGVNVPITQSMFDALVSIAFNTGVGGLRRSDMVEKLKAGNYQEAGDRIKTLKVSKKFPGLAKRREVESKMFLASL
jgi:lysozyme